MSRSSRKILAAVLIGCCLNSGALSQSTLEDLNIAVDATISQFTALPLSLPLENLVDRGLSVIDPTLGSGARWSGGQQTVQPVFSWAADRQVSAVRLLKDNTGNNLDQVIVDTLVAGGNPTNPADWVQRVDTGPGLSGAADNLVDLDLGGTFVTRGIRLTVSINSPGDMFLGEIEIYGPEVVGSLAAIRVDPTGWSASSTAPGTSPSFAGVYGDRWLSLPTDQNPGDFFALDRTFSGETMNHIWVGLRDVFDGATLPSQWTLQADTGGGFVDVETFSTQLGLTKYAFPTLTNVQAVRVKVLESEVPAGGRIGVSFSEVFYYLPSCTDCEAFLADVYAVICGIAAPTSLPDYQAQIAALVQNAVQGTVCSSGPSGGDEAACEALLVGELMVETVCRAIQSQFN